ncbi:type II secretion system F family protein [Jeotgalibaca sp. A127]|uniref:type II secretion system F family protein n=1 Tax=Jeotgalibaca sp. A127 TaxID=3457324 RepID=UPI003FD4343C
MAVFAYRAKTSDGKLMKGKIESTNKKEALQELQQMSLVVYRVEPLNVALNKDINLRKTLKQKDFIIFLRQFATLLNAGILLVDAVELLAEQTSDTLLKEALENLAAEIREGEALSSAMANQSPIFPELLVHMIHSAEASGRLEEVLDQMATYYEKQYRIKKKVETAMTYPLVVGVLALVITIFLLVFIVPVFSDMFASMGEELPAITKGVLSLSNFFKDYWWFILIMMGIAGVVLKQLAQNEKYTYLWDTFILKMPVVGMFMQKTLLARMTQTLSSLLNSSVPILDAIKITSQVVGNRVVGDVLMEARRDVEQGESLAKAMVGHWFFPALIVQMIQVGESSGELDTMLKKVSDIYDQELQEASDKLQSLIEPIMIIVLSVIVGFIVMAIVVPMFSMFQTF